MEIDISEYVRTIPQDRVEELFKRTRAKPDSLFSSASNEVIIDKELPLDEIYTVLHQITETSDVETVQYIKIENNKQEVPIEFLKPFSKLRALDLSCKISIENLFYLELESIVYLHITLSTEVIESPLPTMPSLLHLIISEPSGARSYRSDPTHNHAIVVKNFRISSVPSDFLHNNPQLIQIHLSAHIGTFPSNFFSKSTYLKDLSIEGEFEGISQSLFQPLNNLQYLTIQLDGNDAVPYIFKGLSNLEFLQINLYDIKFLPTGFFDGMTNLISLKVHLNESETDASSVEGLPEISEDLFIDLTNLKTLEWKGIIPKIPIKLFQNQHRLSKLYMNSAYTRQIDKAAFANLNELSELVFFVNVTKFEPESFSGLHSLRRLLLLSNTLEEVKSPLFNDLHNLESLIINNGGKKPFKVDTDLVINCTKLKDLELQYMEPVGLLFKLFNDFEVLHTVELVIPPEYQDKLQAYLRISGIDIPNEMFIDPVLERVENGEIRKINRLRVRFYKT